MRRAPLAGVDFPDLGAPLLLLHAVLGDIAVRADGDVELGAVAARDQVLGPVMVARPRGQVGHLGARGGDPRLAFLIGKAHHGVGVRHVEHIADERHAEGRVEALEKRLAQLGHAVAVGIAEAA